MPLIVSLLNINKMSNKKLSLRIKKFADVELADGRYKHWIEYENGHREDTTNDFNSLLWSRWSLSHLPTREDVGNTKVFVFNEPISLYN